MPRPATKSLRDRIINGAIAQGKFTESRRPHYERLWDSDPTECAALIAELTPNLLTPQEAAELEGHMPVRAAGGGGHIRSNALPAGGDDAYDPQWLTARERAQVEAAREGQPLGRIIREA